MKMGLTVLAIVFLGSYLIGSLLKNNKQAEFIVHNSTCDLLVEKCRIQNKGIEYEIAFDGVPSPLTPFNVRFTAFSSQPSNVKIEFEMEGMDMGSNFYSLENKVDYWDANVLLPVCSLGRNDWILRVSVLYDEKTYLSEFKFSQ